MERENFFLLLELSVDPPEDDPSVIEAAIRKKQAEWSRFRNHPTKSIQAKQFIELIPEIRKVMLDADLRRTEAYAAKNLIETKQDQRFSEVDRHIGIRMAKGYITDEEIAQLAQFHNVTADDVRKRVEKTEKAKLAVIDKQLGIRMGKGYISEQEIAKLSSHHGISKAEIRKRIKVPITRGNVAAKNAIQPLERSIEKVIAGHLKIVGKSNLYEFLGLSPGASLQALQEKARETEKQILKLGKKDAVATASEALVGHCMTLFKTEQSRNAYDVSRAQAFLTELNADIDIAGMDGKIRAEYLDKLVETATGYGMDAEDARRHIAAYCKDKGWQIEADEPGRNPVSRKKIALLGTVLLMALILGGISFYYLRARSVAREYGALLITVNAEKKLEKKIIFLEKFIKAHAGSEQADEAKRRVSALDEQIQKKEFARVDRQAKSLLAEDKFDDARALYENFKHANTKSKFSRDAARRLDDIQKKQEKKDFEQVKLHAREMKPKRIEAFKDYLDRYPKGKHRGEVEKLIADMSEEYFLTIAEELARWEHSQNWAKCIEVSERYIAIYGGNNRSDQLKELMTTFQDRLHDQLIFNKLKADANRKGTDYAAARQIYENFLVAYPKTHEKEAIKRELERLTELENRKRIRKQSDKARERLEAVSSRFVEQRNGAVTDRTTGLTWTLLDSNEALGDCLDYDSAASYVASLQTGGYNDWRIPTPEELAAIYKKKPAFPSDTEQWYWTSKFYSKYSSGWSKMVETVTTAPEAPWTQERIDSRVCGAIRAVRP